MELNNNELMGIIEKILEEMSKTENKDIVTDGIFDTMNEAIEASYIAQKTYSRYTIKQR